MKLELIGKPEGCKLLRMTIEIAPPPSPSSRILAVSIRGDFFAIPEEEFDTLERALVGIEMRELGREFSRMAHLRGLQCAGISGDGLDELVRSALTQRS